MKKIRRVAFYPVFADTLPIVRYYKQYRSDIEIVELLSPLGSCACGRDAGYLDNRETFGMRIKNQEEANPAIWDELYLMHHDVLGMEENEVKESLYDPIVLLATSAGKSVRYISKMDQNDEYLTLNMRGNQQSGILYPVNRYTVFVGGVIGASNSFEVFLRLYGELSKHLDVAAFSSSINAKCCDLISLHGILYHQAYTESEKVFAINNVILRAIRDNNPNLVLIHVEEAMMSFSNSKTNGFGIVPYMVSQVLSPDYSVCCLPCDCADSMFIQEFAQGLEGRFCFSPDIWHVSNALLDNSVATELQDLNAVYAPIGSVNSVIRQNKNSELTIGTFMDDEFLLACTSKILTDYAINDRVEIIN